MSYTNNRTWADQYLPWAAEVLRANAGKLLTVEVAPDDKDKKEATDLILHFDGGDIAFRVRRPSCGFRDFTLRTQYDNRPYSELHKIQNGFADWYLYAWTDKVGRVSDWIIVDLDKVRER